MELNFIRMTNGADAPSELSCCGAGHTCTGRRTSRANVSTLLVFGPVQQIATVHTLLTCNLSPSSDCSFSF